MLGDLLLEETGTTTGMRVLSQDDSGTVMEVTLQTQGTICGVEETTLWTYSSTMHADGSISGEGIGMLTTANGDVLRLTGSGSAPGFNADGTLSYRGAIYIRTTSEGFAQLHGTAGVYEYDVNPDGTASTKMWAWN